MPFGLMCAPSVFQRLMDLVLCGLTYESVLIYHDDIIGHLHRLRGVFERLRRAGLKLHPAKCSLFQRRVSFLGHVILNGGIQV